jgi:ribosome biogenesis protein SSF1/2
VIRNGKVSKATREIISNVRQIMEPNTASKLRERRHNNLNDYIQVAGQFNINNYLVFSETSKINLAIGKHPKGPTLYFTVNNYTLSKELNQFSKFTTPPLLILNGFTSTDKHVVLMASMFQNMFPTLNVATVRIPSSTMSPAFYQQLILLASS